MTAFRDLVSADDLAMIKDEMRVIDAIKTVVDERIERETTEEFKAAEMSYQLAQLAVTKGAMDALNQRLDRLWDVAVASGLPLSPQG